MRKYNRTIRNLVCLLALSFALPACEIDDIPDPNSATLEDIMNQPTVGKLNNLVVGSESAMRNNLGNYYDAVSVIGREIYRLSGSDPRFTTDLLGFQESRLDPNVFYITNPWSARYSVIKNLNVLIEVLEKSDLVSSGKLTEAQRNGYLGFAKTIQAHQLLLNLNMTHENGIRIDVKDPDNLGPVVGRAQSLTTIAGLLNEADGHLRNAGETFLFPLSSGYNGFNTPATFLEFNRGLAARIAVYRENWNEALSYLDDSFLDLAGNLNTGVYHVFGTGSGDQLNPVFFPQNAGGEVRLAHPSYITGTVASDDRLQKVSRRTSAGSQNGLSSEYDVFVYKTNTAPVPVIRNEELILIYAEASIQNGALPQAVTALNRIRISHGLTAYTGPVTRPALIDEMLYQRRYSLYFEGHRWIDMRRYNRLNQLPIDRPADDVWTQFPIPFSEGA